MSAINAIFRLLAPGDHIIAMSALYGGTIQLLDESQRLFKRCAR